MKKTKTPVVKISFEAYHKIRDTIGRRPPEVGGLAFGFKKDGIIRQFFLDTRAVTTTNRYDPHCDTINPIIQAFYDRYNMDLLAMVHSHPTGYTKPSGGDIDYVERLLKHPELDQLYLPIVQTGDNPEIHMYVFRKKNPRQPIKAKLEVLDPVTPAKPERVLTDFSRLEGAVDIALMQSQKVLVIGVGGSMDFCKGLARTGLGELHSFDPDIVDESNTTRCGFELADIGLPKTFALGEHLKRINPTMRYVGSHDDLLQLPDEDLDLLMPQYDLIVASTDNFKAQAKVNELATKYKIPAIFSGFYAGSKCAEIVFSIPEVTACYRCAVGSRYDAQAAQEIKVPSTGNTIFAGMVLDGFMGLLALAILHRHTTGFSFSGWFRDDWTRNLVQIKLHPDFGQDEGHIFQQAYGDTNYAQNFTSVWQAISQDLVATGAEFDCPNCAPELPELLETAAAS